MSGSVLSSGANPVIGSLLPPGSTSVYAREMTDMAEGYIRSLALVTSTLAPPVIRPVFPTVTTPPVPVTTPPPTMTPVVWTSPGLPVAFSESLNINTVMPEPFDGTPPTLIFGAAPTAFTDVVPVAPGINLQFVYPDLTVSLPAPPALLTLQTYAFGGVTLPTALTTDDIPVLTVVAPSVVPYTPGAFYTSGLLTAMRAYLLNQITVGGTGLAPAVEQAIWDRGRERELRQSADAIADLDRMEVLGYALPPGVYLNARIKIQTELGYSIAGLSREVMIKQAELEQTNVQEALKVSTQLESQLLTYSNQVEQRLFDATKYATEAGIEVYNARVRAYAAYLDAYKTKVQIYEAQVRGELAKVEVYKAQIQAEEAKAQINTALVAQYKVQADVALSAIEIFKAQIGAITAKAEIEKLKVMTFGEQVRAYAAKINAYTAGVEGYRATIQAEGTKQEAFRTSVQAYSARVDAGIKQAEARIEEFKGRLAAKTQEWDGYRASYQGEAARAQAISATNSTAAEAYRVTITGQASYNDTLTKQWQVALDQAERVAEVGIQAAKSNADLYLTTRSLALDAAKVGAQVSAQLGAAALNAVHWSQSYSASESSGYSQSTQISYNHNLSV